MPNYVVIEKSRSFKKPFRVRFIAENGEQIGNPQLLTTRRNVIKNLVAHMGLFNGLECLVKDRTGKSERIYRIGQDGYESKSNIY